MGDYDEPGSPTRALLRLAHGTEEMSEYNVLPSFSSDSADSRLSEAVRRRLGDETCNKIEQEMRDAEDCRSIKATLCVNCQPGRILYEKGCVYDEKKSVHSNLIGILEKLVLGTCIR